MENLKERSEIDSKDCWDLTKIIKDEEEYQALIKLVRERNQEIVGIKGHILDNASSLAHFFQLSEEEGRALDRLYVYTKESFDEDTRDNKRKEKLLEIQSLIQEVEENESFILSEFMKKDLQDVLPFLEENEELKIYTYYLEELYHSKERVLSEAEEKIITQATNVFGTPEDAFTSLDTSDVSFQDVLVDGKLMPLNHYNYIKFLENDSQEVRENAFLNYHAFYKQHRNTFASILKGNYQELEFIRSIRNYNSALEMALDEIHVPKILYDNLVNSVHEYLDISINYQKLKAKLLSNKEYHLYDTYAPVVSSLVSKYSKEEAISLVKKALNPLGEGYLNQFQKILDGNTVDFYPNIGKHNGAYQWGCYDSPSYVLLNFDETFHSVSTLAHEMGHAIHSNYSRENNPYIYEGYKIFLAEIASTVNEMLLSCYMLEHTKNKDEKMYYLCSFLDKVKSTIYRQTMFSEFETIMSQKCQNHESLTEACFTDTYYKLVQEYFKDSVIIDEDIRYECYRVPHFYTPFYVYQYATGLISTISIVSDILENKPHIVENYIQFLSSGSSMNVLDILKLVDVDLTTKEPFERAFQFIEKKLLELQLLVKEGEFSE